MPQVFHDRENKVSDLDHICIDFSKCWGEPLLRGKLPLRENTVKEPGVLFGGRGDSKKLIGYRQVSIPVRV